ncbi:MAG: hypothetical protein ACRCXM_08855 [Beijerinckiaceae bacterium]
MTATFDRAWAMPSPDTFSVMPIMKFVLKHKTGITVDPFARNGKIGDIRNDLNPETSAEYHMDACDFIHHIASNGVMADTILFDPPYSPRQISEVYKSFGRDVTARDTQNAALYKRVRDSMMRIMKPDTIVLSFGWNSSGMGLKRGFEIFDILLVAHGGAHNDTICIAEKAIQGSLRMFSP